MKDMQAQFESSRGFPETPLSASLFATWRLIPRSASCLPEAEHLDEFASAVKQAVGEREGSDIALMLHIASDRAQQA